MKLANDHLLNMCPKCQSAPSKRFMEETEEETKESTAYVFDVALLQAQVLAQQVQHALRQLVKISKTTHKQQLR
jgi:hypothetical protein